MLLAIFLLTHFAQLGETIPEGPFQYRGKLPREIITCDPAHSPILEAKYKEWVEEVRGANGEEQILHQLLTYLRAKTFSIEECTPAKVIRWIETNYKESKEAEIPLDAFLEARLGVCRHTALTTTYFLDRMVKEGRLQGKPFLIREELPFGRHAWTLLLTEQGAWHIDTLWGVIANGKTKVGYQRLCSLYGKGVMERQKLRWTIAE